jgi:hypothetical protein
MEAEAFAVFFSAIEQPRLGFYAFAIVLGLTSSWLQQGAFSTEAKNSFSKALAIDPENVNTFEQKITPSNFRLERRVIFG